MRVFCCSKTRNEDFKRFGDHQGFETVIFKLISKNGEIERPFAWID